MRYFHNFNDSNWVSQYKYSDQTWLTDSLNWDKLGSVTFSDYSFISFLTNSSFINQHLTIDYLNKVSNLDVILLSGNSWSLSVAVLFNNYVNDIYLLFSINYLYALPLFTSSYQDILNVVLLLSPEVIIAFNDYLSTYYGLSTVNKTSLVFFDSYTNNLNYNFNEGLLSVFTFFLFTWFIVYFFTMSVSLKWSNLLISQFTRFYFFFFSASKDTRVQFEAVVQTGVFFIFYWSLAIMAFDDDKEELIEYLDTVFFYLFTFILFNFFFKHSIHYFSFLEASASGSRSTMFLTSQFKGDFLALFSMILRFYSLLLRLNVYDILDDCLDFYYVFIGDFDDDEYLNELFLSLHGTIFFTMDNQDDRSFLLEDENDFSNDFFYMYFVLWGKVFYFLFYTVELIARFALAFFVIYLILFDIYGVNCSYKEDNYMNIKKN